MAPGASVGLARQVGLLAGAEAYHGVDVWTGQKVDWVDKVVESSNRISSTASAATPLAGGLRSLMAPAKVGPIGVPKSIVKAPNSIVGWAGDAVEAAHIPKHKQLTPTVEASGLRGWWRNKQVKNAGKKLGYDPDKIRYVEEMGQIGNKHPLGGARNPRTGEILIDRFAFDSQFLQEQGLPGYRAVVAHEVGHSYPVPTGTTINPANKSEFWASFYGATKTEQLSNREVDALLQHAYKKYR